MSVLSRLAIVLFSATYVVVVGVGCAPLSKNGSSTVRVSLSDDWQQADRLNRLGIKHLRDGQPNLAEANFRRAIHASEGHGGAHNNLGLIHYNRRELHKAAGEFQKAVDYMPYRASPVNNLGMALEKGGRLAEAIEFYQQAHEMEPTNALFLGNLVRGKIRTGCVDDLAIQQLRDLVFYDKRCDWTDWAKEQLELHYNPHLDRGPPTPESPLSPSQSNDRDSRTVLRNETGDDHYLENSNEQSRSPQHETPPLSDPAILDTDPTIQDPGESILELSDPRSGYQELPAPIPSQTIEQMSGEMPFTENLRGLVDVQIDDL